MAEPKKYVGMRYVPKFAEPLEWNTNNKYEPLEMVLHGGNYYISRQFVPVDIDILNKEYWLPFALTLDGAAGLVSRVDSNTDAIIQNATALHEVENKATQNSLDIAGNVEDISTNLEMINKLVDHLKLIDKGNSVNQIPGATGAFMLKTSLDGLKFFADINIYTLDYSAPASFLMYPPGTIKSRSQNIYNVLTTGASASIEIRPDGSVYLNLKSNNTYCIGSLFIDYGLNTNTMTLPMTENDYNQLESEVNND